MPLANGFLGAGDLGNERFFDLAVAFCDRCALMQLTTSVPRELMFNAGYPFRSSSSALMTAHFHALGDAIARQVAGQPQALVVEIGSNDGTLLERVSAAGIRHLGVEPSAGVAEAARAKGLQTLCRFFDLALAGEIVEFHGKADAIVATNCFCHIDDLHSLAEGIVLLLKPGGILTFEDPYLGDIVKLNAYDQIYDEHASYFSLTAVMNWLRPHGLEVIDVVRKPVHGGSLRYRVAHTGAHQVSPRVAQLRDEESVRGLNCHKLLSGFRDSIERSRDALLILLTRLRKQGKRVAGYGATSKSTTLLNYCGIDAGLIHFIADTTPQKQGLLSPGMHIPIRPPGAFSASYPDYAVLFAWNHAREVLAKERGFMASGGEWILYVPEVATYGKESASRLANLTA